MYRWARVIPVVLAAALVAVTLQLPWFRPAQTGPNPRPVSGGDREIAYLHNPTAYENWDNFVWGVKRAEMAAGGEPSGLQVDDAEAFPHRTTAVPEIAIRKKGYDGRLLVRWYKVTDDASQQAWVKGLAARNPPPVAVLGGWSSDRAKELADAMREQAWPGGRPLLFLVTATADQVDPEGDNPSGSQAPPLISVYDRTFRFCFTNRQMADAVTDFVLADPTLRPRPAPRPGAAALPVPVPDPLSTLAALAGEWAAAPPLPGFAIEWRDDPYSTDLSLKFRLAFRRMAGSVPGVPPIDMDLYSVPFSTGRMNRPNPVEAEIAGHILANLPPPGARTVLVIPSVVAPTRRVLRTLVQGNPQVDRRLVAVTGDGLGVNTFFRDRDFAWPVRSIPIPVAMFTHADPFAWDSPSGPRPPEGYELAPPAADGVRSSTEDIQLFTRLAGVLGRAAFPPAATAVVPTADALDTNLRSLDPPFFDADGNRLSDTGEHVVLLRPVFPGEKASKQSHPDATLEVYTRQPGKNEWHRMHTLTLGGH
jgi:hypothetical protein